MVDILVWLWGNVYLQISFQFRWMIRPIQSHIYSFYIRPKCSYLRFVKRRSFIFPYEYIKSIFLKLFTLYFFTYSYIYRSTYYRKCLHFQPARLDFKFDYDFKGMVYDHMSWMVFVVWVIIWVIHLEICHTASPKTANVAGNLDNLTILSISWSTSVGFSNKNFTLQQIWYRIFFIGSIGNYRLVLLLSWISYWHLGFLCNL